MVMGIALWVVLMAGNAGAPPQAKPDVKEAAEPLKLRVSPAISREPGIVDVTVRIPPNPDNRALSVTVDAGDYYTSSSMALDGEREPGLRLFAYRSLPPGEYVVTVTLKNRQGRATVAEQTFRVLSQADGGAPSTAGWNSPGEDVPVSAGYQSADVCEEARQAQAAGAGQVVPPRWVELSIGDAIENLLRRDDGHPLSRCPDVGQQPDEREQHQRRDGAAELFDRGPLVSGDPARDPSPAAEEAQDPDQAAQQPAPRRATPPPDGRDHRGRSRQDRRQRASHESREKRMHGHHGGAQERALLLTACVRSHAGGWRAPCGETGRGGVAYLLPSTRPSHLVRYA